MSEPWTLSEEAFKVRQEAANDALQEAAMREPTLACWGVESYGDGPAAWGGGVGGFAWFETQADLLDFMAEHLTFLNIGPADVDPGRVGREAQAILASYRAGALDADATRERLNVALRGFQQVRWWGPLQDLLTCEADFPREVRAWFRGELEDEEEEAAPIQEEELEEFLGMLSEWGI